METWRLESLPYPILVAILIAMGIWVTIESIRDWLQVIMHYLAEEEEISP